MLFPKEMLVSQNFMYPEANYQTDVNRRRPHGNLIIFFFSSTVDHMKAESSKTKEEMQRKYEQMLEKDRNHQEHTLHMIEKMERDRAQLVAEQEKTMTLILQVFHCAIPTH